MAHAHSVRRRQQRAAQLAVGNELRQLRTWYEHMVQEEVGARVQAISPALHARVPPLAQVSPRGSPAAYTPPGIAVPSSWVWCVALVARCGAVCHDTACLGMPYHKNGVPTRPTRSLCAGVDAARSACGNFSCISTSWASGKRSRGGSPRTAGGALWARLPVFAAHGQKAGRAVESGRIPRAA